MVVKYRRNTRTIHKNTSNSYFLEPQVPAAAGICSLWGLIQWTWWIIGTVSFTRQRSGRAISGASGSKAVFYLLVHAVSGMFRLKWLFAEMDRVQLPLERPLSCSFSSRDDRWGVCPAFLRKTQGFTACSERKWMMTLWWNQGAEAKKSGLCPWFITHTLLCHAHWPGFSEPYTGPWSLQKASVSIPPPSSIA